MGSPFYIAWTLLKSRQILKYRNPETGEAWSSPEAMDEYISDLHDTDDDELCPSCNNPLGIDDVYAMDEVGVCMNCWKSG